MKREALYSGFGQALVAAVLGLLTCSIYWAWSALSNVAHLIVGNQFALVVALLAVVAMIAAARWSVSTAILLFVCLAGIDRLFLASPSSALNTFVGATCLLFAAVVGIGMLSQRARWARNHFPKVLMVVLGVVFLAPVAIIAKSLEVDPAELRLVARLDRYARKLRKLQTKALTRRIRALHRYRGRALRRLGAAMAAIDQSASCASDGAPSRPKG